jgi:hypothetical protein
MILKAPTMEKKRPDLRISNTRCSWNLGKKKDAPLMCIDLKNERHGACVDLRVRSGPGAGK